MLGLCPVCWTRLTRIPVRPGVSVDRCTCGYVHLRRREPRTSVAPDQVATREWLDEVMAYMDEEYRHRTLNAGEIADNLDRWAAVLRTG